MKPIPILAVDFDGVLHSYKSGWKGPRNIPDPPVEGAIDWLISLLGWPDSISVFGEDYKNFKVCIFSSRSKYWGGRRAMKKWLVKHGLDQRYFKVIDFPLHKPPSMILLDDRAWTFKGIFPTEEEMLAFKPWNK